MALCELVAVAATKPLDVAKPDAAYAFRLESVVKGQG
jgi:hypothetical protein